MWKFAVLLTCLSGYCLGGPVGPKRNMPMAQQMYENAAVAEVDPAASADSPEMLIMSSLSLPSNATSIRADITDGFSCENRTYGYYADVDNDCQIFHVCLPVTYADGKENTFRWSFICPEDTVFSQDSFTCMRPDDMTITCAESYQYYELNRNFGIVEPAADKEINNEATTDNESVAEAQQELEVAKPFVPDEEEKIVEQPKPFNVVKPSRRKPAISYPTQKKPINSYPLRRIPQTQTHSQIPETPATQILEDANTIKPVEEEQIKPVVFKFPRRPVPAMPNSLKDEIQNSKPESGIPTRNELFNQVRKRPNLFERKPEEQPEEKKRVDQSKIDSEQQQHNFSPLAADMSISNSEPQVAEAEIEASESNHVFVKAIEADEVPQNIENGKSGAEEPIQVLEAFEEIPTVVAEIAETPDAKEEENKSEENLTLSNENPSIADEPQITEEAQSAEEVQTDDEIVTRKETQPRPESADETQKVVETQAVGESEATEDTITSDETKISEEAQAAPEAPQSLKTTEGVAHNVDEYKTTEETQSEDKSDEAETEADSEQKSEVVQVAVENPLPEVPHALEEAKKTAEIPEDIQNVQEAQAEMESQYSEKPETVEKSEAAPAPKEKSEVNKEEMVAEQIHENQQNLRSSAEETQNVEEAVIAEGNSIGQTYEKIPAAEKSEAISEFAAAENAQVTGNTQEMQASPISEEVPAVEETAVVQEIQNNEHSQEHEPMSQILAQDTLTVEEPQAVVYKSDEPVLLEEHSHSEDSKSMEEPAETEQVAGNIDSEPVKSENLNSAEEENASSLTTVEQMESEKPAEAPESMPASEEMSHPDAMVQKMYENMDSGKQSIGGFKPVDPVMAHEAEQLIVDFINTLRKNDFTNDAPVMHIEHQTDEVSEEAQPEKSSDLQETEKFESNEETLGNTSGALEQDDKDKAETEAESSDAHIESVESNKEELQEVHGEEPNLVPEESNELNNFKSSEADSIEDAKESQNSEETITDAINLPQEMYQIPVQVIPAHAEDISIKEDQSQEQESETAEVAGSTEEKMQETPIDMPIAGHKPLSIDDIVELVKERLDHMPKDEMEKPMQLEQVLGEANEDKVAEEKLDEQSSVQEEEQEHSSQSEEEIVMPIYQRTVQPAQINAGVQTENLEATLNEEQPQAPDAVADIKEKTNRSYRSRSVQTPKVDSRKRHFLFKTESS